MASPLRFLAFGDSLTAGFCDHGLRNHPYSINLYNLFSSSNIPIVIDEKGVSGERVVPSMVRRLENLLSKSNDSPYDWIIILGGTNDLGYRVSAEKIFNEGLKLMYDMTLQHGNRKSKLAAMTVIQNGVYSPENVHDQQRQKLNNMIRNYVQNYEDQNRICLVDLDLNIQYHSMENIQEKKVIWDDMVHLKPYGYDRMAEFIFQQIYKKIS
jgi:lysophospholipase L1-like esterase